MHTYILSNIYLTVFVSGCLLFSKTIEIHKSLQVESILFSRVEFIASDIIPT